MLEVVARLRKNNAGDSHTVPGLPGRVPGAVPGICDPDSHFFVTKSGKVYTCPQLDLSGKMPNELTVLWDDPKRPVTMVVNDPDHLRTFVAGPDPAEKGRWFYFELDGGRDPKPAGYAPGAVDGLPKPVSAVTHFARFL